MKNGYLLTRLVMRDFREKYKGSVLGFLWTLVLPVMILGMYTFFFSEIFQRKWVSADEKDVVYSLVIFCGLIVINMVNDVLGRATTLMKSNVNYIKKVVFPLELLPMTITISACIQGLISYIMLLAGNMILSGNFYCTSFESIILFAPLFMISLGIAYFVSALTVYIKDINSIVSLVCMVVLYVSPVFYSITNIPESFRIIVYLNPLTYIIENLRANVLYGEHLNMLHLIIVIIAGFIYYAIGLIVFRKLKRGFADVM